MASLLALSRAASDEAKRKLSARLWMHLGTFALTVAAFWLHEPLVQVPAAIAVVTEAIAWWLRVSGEALHDRAEEAKRAALLCNAFGSSESIDASDLRASFADSLHERARQLESSGYYSSKTPPGAERLRELLQESAFFSKHLFAAASRQALALGLLPVVGLVAAIVLAAPFSDPSTTLLLTRLLVAVLSLLISADELGHAIAWHASGQLADRVDHALDSIDLERMDALTAAFADYGVATSSAPPIPTHLYDKMRDRLNKAWQERTSARQKSHG